MTIAITVADHPEVGMSPTTVPGRLLTYIMLIGEPIVGPSKMEVRTLSRTERMARYPLYYELEGMDHGEHSYMISHDAYSIARKNYPDLPWYDPEWHAA